MGAGPDGVLAFSEETILVKDMVDGAAAYYALVRKYLM